MGISVVSSFKLKDKWRFKHDNKMYHLSPPDIMNLTLSPITSCFDKFVDLVIEKKNFQSAENLLFLFSEHFFPNADVKFNLVDLKYNGWVYSLEELNLRDFLPGQLVWICSYLCYFFKDAPKSLYFKLETKK